MNLRSIWMKSTFYKSFTWSTTNAKGDILYHDEIYPAKFAPSETSNVLNSTFLGYATAPFTQWKGSIVVQGRLAKTQYHSGSIRISWVPGLYDIDFNANVINSPNFNMNMNYSEVIDIKENNEFTFVVPYTSTAPALWNVNPHSKQADNIAKHNWCCGSIVIDVFTDLVANETIVVPTIDIAIRVSGGSDLEMMGATAPNIFPYSPVVQTEGVSGDEMGERSQEDQEILNPITGRLKNSFLTSALLTGECVTSVKNFLGRQALYAKIDNSTTTSTIKISPYDFQRPLSALSENITNFDFLDYFSFIYGWYAGGVNLSIYNLSNNIVRYYEVRSLPGLNSYYPSTFERARALTTTEQTSYDNTLAQLPLPTQVVKSDLEGMVHIMVPYYNRVQITPALTKQQTLNLTEEGSYPTPILYVKAANVFPNTKIYRAATDSFQFYYLLGPPQVVLLSGSAQLTPFIYPDVLMKRQKQAVGDVGSGTLKVSPFFQNNQIDFVGQQTLTLAPDTQFLTRYQTTSSDPWSFMICPGGDTYNFTLSGGDMRITKSGISLYAWDLLNGSVSILNSIGSSSAFYRLVSVDSSNSEPIKRSTISSVTLSYNHSNATIPGINGGSTITYNTDVVVNDDILVYNTSLIIIPKGSFLRISMDNTALACIYGGSVYYFVGSFGDDIKYTAGLFPNPYVLNDPI